MPQEVDQHVEDLRLDVGDRPIAMQLTPIDMDFTVAEYKDHVAAFRGIATFSSNSPAFVQDSD